MFQVSLRVYTPCSILVPYRGPSIVDEVQIRRWTAAQAAERAVQRILERLSEVPIEVRVDYRVQGGVEVPDPENYCYHLPWTVPFTGLTEIHTVVPDEEGQPAQYERAHYDA